MRSVTLINRFNKSRFNSPVQFFALLFSVTVCVFYFLFWPRIQPYYLAGLVREFGIVNAGLSILIDLLCLCGLGFCVGNILPRIWFLQHILPLIAFGLLLVQGLAVRMSGEPLTAELIIQSGLLRYSLTPSLLLFYLASVVCWIALLHFNSQFFISPHISKELKSRRILICIGIPILIWLPYFNLLGGTQRIELRQKYGLRLDSPLIELVKELSRLVDLGKTAEAAPVTAELIEAGRKIGVSTEGDAVFPFRKDYIYKERIAYPDKKSEPIRNVIVLFIESLTASLLQPYGYPLPNLTPHINEFAKHSCRIDDYYNHITPTVTGIKGQLCSMYPKLTWTSWKQSPNLLYTGAVLCLPHIVSRHGFDTVYLSHADPTDTHLQAQAVSFGFKELYFNDQVLTKFLKGEKGEISVLGYAQPSDHQMFRAAKEMLMRRDPSSKPLFLAISTIETHEGLSSSKAEYGDGANPLLNSIFGLDQSFGEFWDYLKNSEYSNNTILVLTGDHTHYPSEVLTKLLGDRAPKSKFSKMGLIIYDPSRELPAYFSAHSTSIDLAPTLVQLLRIPNAPNNFMGLSLFSDRKGIPAAGMIYGLNLLLTSEREGVKEIPITDCGANRRKEGVSNFGSISPCLIFQLLKSSQERELTTGLISRFDIESTFPQLP